MSIKILVIDDEESIRFTFSSFLSKEGYEVLTAADYTSALEIISGQDLDLIFTDIILKEQTGIDILREVKDRDFGTGKYYSSADKTNTDFQYFYGIKDPCTYGNCGAGDEVALGDLYPLTNNVTILTNEEVVGAPGFTTWDALLAEIRNNREGWYRKLATGGERVLNRPSILGGVLLFTPFKPEDDICGYGGTGSLYALYYETGTAFPEAILGTTPYGASKQESVSRIELGKGLTSEIGLHVGQKETSTGFIQQGTGSVVQVDVDPALSIKSGIIGWHQR